MTPDDFDFHLPSDLIALRPAVPRDSARLLVVRAAGGDMQLEDRLVIDLPELLSPGDLLLANNTRVIHAALSGIRHAREGGQDVAVSATLHRRLPGPQRTAFLKPGRRVRTADRITFAPDLAAVVTEALDGGEYVLAFNQSDEALDALIERYGSMPLPPYIASKRMTDERDRSDYQTVYAERPGSVAAPTAGLHITEALRDRLSAAGIDWRTVTLHVNAGTFQPVKVDRLEDHRMHAEYAEMPAETATAINATRARGGRCVAIGTTSLRTLESAAHGGVVRPFAGETSIFIRPGYRFQAADALLTNFHLPRSTLFILVCALAGAAAMRRAYQHAIDRRYRFYSYGDACLILPHG